MNSFSAGASIRFGWETFKKRTWFFIGATALIIVVSILLDSFVQAFGDEDVAGFVGSLISLVVGTFIGMGVTAFFLKAHDTPESAELMDLWHPEQFWSYLIASIVMGVLVCVGLILLIVPGVILILMLMFTTYIVIDRKLGPIDALKESRRITAGNRLALFGLLLAAIAINILGALLLLVGLLVSIPVTTLALVHAYRTLEHSASEIAPKTA